EDFKGGGKQIVLYGYLNEKARHDGAQPLTAAQVTLAGDDYVADQDRAGVYASIKGLEDWVGAEDA
ncbi:MAG TPA: hypothetical protein DCE33_08730, partial [Rhodospirillaceae bacterium]|nr:hypothetical protein [Rhodospirillaceae bacterium]